ncbi:hypothetical protein JCM8097_004286 [Rhodosporidiobolus ruineniae]
MSFSQPQLPPPGTKPSLAGVHIKQRYANELDAGEICLLPHSSLDWSRERFRDSQESCGKGQAKAASKFEPLVFRDAIVKHLSACSPNDYDSVTQKLDALATQLDYRRYAEQLFQILLVGAVLAPGGSFVEDGGVGRCAFSIATTGGDADKADVKELKKAVGVFERLVRRYKYLQHDFEESVLKQVLGYIGKFSPVEQERLAVSAALFNQAGLAPVSVIGAVRTAHLVKDGTAQTALLNFLKTYPATGEPIDPVLTALRKAGLSDLDAFFVPGKRTAAEVTAALRSSKLNSTADWFVKLKSTGVRDEVNKKVKSLLADHADPEEISAALEPIAARSVPSLLTEGDFISIVFLALMRIDLNAESNAVVDEAVKQVNEYGSVLEPFAAKATSEVALINTVQVWVHENPKLVPAFLRILKTLVGADVISSGPLSYWYNKGSKPQGREALLAKAAPLVKFLEEQEDEESDEE